MHVERTPIPGVLLLTALRHRDGRGVFAELWNRRTLAECGIMTEFVQDNHSISDRAGTLRGLHYQAPPHAQAKLVRCGRGRVFDVAVDIRKDSPSFGTWFGVEIGAEDGRQIYLPEGVLHGFVTREPASEVVYKCSAHYEPASDRTVRWDSCGIGWDLLGPPILSEKDARAPALGEIDSPFHWCGP